MDANQDFGSREFAARRSPPPEAQQKALSNQIEARAE
jgi:hypothetical protein